MAAIICTSAPPPTRIVTPSTSISIVPTSGSDWHRDAWRRRRRTGARATASTTAGTNCNSSASEAAASLNWRRQPNNCCGDNPWRRATAQTESPLATISATIRALSSWCHFRRRPAPVKTSSRRTGSVIAIGSVSILSPTVKTKPQTRRSQHHPEGARKTTLTWKARRHEAKVVGMIKRPPGTEAASSRVPLPTCGFGRWQQGAGRGGVVFIPIPYVGERLADSYQ
jgi:hypothetical protein